MVSHTSDQEKIRLSKVKALQDLGIDPYPSQSFEVNTTTAAIKEQYAADESSCQDISLAGRLMSHRIMGGVSFAELQDHTGKIQLYLHRDTLCPGEDKTTYNTLFRKLLDIGDIIGVEGNAFITKVGALAVNVKKLSLLTKAIKPLPVVKEVQDEGGKTTFYNFSDPEQRYRQRYLDLILNPEVQEVFIKRARIINTIRRFFDACGYLEVETPVLQPIYGGASARPFTTYHNTLGMELYLRISNELYLKRLIVGGYPGVYEFAKDFRNEGMSRFHNPEFTQVEVYVAYRDYQWMMDQVETLIQQVALDLHQTTKVTCGEYMIDFKKPWKRYTLFEAIEHFTGYDIRPLDEPALRALADKLHVPLADAAGKGKIIDALFGAKCEPYLIQPTFITDYPVEMSPLAKQHRNNPELVERFEVICNGKEICNAFSELNDPVEQRKRFEAQQALASKGDKEAMMTDEDFLRALGYGMPPTVGLGVGIDRLTMLMTNRQTIQEVILFPQMRRE